MSEREQEQSVSEALATELVALLEGMEQERARSREERREWNREQARGAEEWERTRLLSNFRETVAHQATEQTALTQRLEHQHAPWLLGWSRDRWRVVGVSVVLALIVSWGGVGLYTAVGPPAKARAETEATLNSYREWWEAATPPQRQQIQQQREKIWEQQNKQRSGAPQ